MKNKKRNKVTDWAADDGIEKWLKSWFLKNWPRLATADWPTVPLILLFSKKNVTKLMIETNFWAVAAAAAAVHRLIISLISTAKLASQSDCLASVTQRKSLTWQQNWKKCDRTVVDWVTTGEFLSLERTRYVCDNGGHQVCTNYHNHHYCYC